MIFPEWVKFNDSLPSFDVYKFEDFVPFETEREVREIGLGSLSSFGRSLPRLQRARLRWRSETRAVEHESDRGRIHRRFHYSWREYLGQEERERETVGIPRTLVGNRKPRMRFELLKSDGNEVRRTRREITASLDSLLSIFRPDATAGERANSFRRLNEAGSVISRVARNIRRGSNFHARNARTIAPMSRSRALSTLEFAVRAMPYLSASILPEFTGTFANLYIRSVQGTRKLYSRWNPLIVALNVTLSEWRDIESFRFSRNCTRVITSRRSLSNRSSKILSHFFVRYCVSSLFLFLISFSCIPK